MSTHDAHYGCLRSARVGYMKGMSVVERRLWGRKRSGEAGEAIASNDVERCAKIRHL